MEKLIETAGNKIFYRVSGEGKTVMLVHGFGETGEVWKSQSDFLDKDFRVIVPDLPGSGRSTPIADMSMEGIAEILTIILDAEMGRIGEPGDRASLAGSAHEEKCIMIGHSMGGYITLAFASKYPSYLSAFGLFHSSAFADNDEKKETRRKGIEFIHQHGAFEFLKNATPNLFSPRSKEEKAELIDGFISSLNNFSAPALVSYYEAMMKRPDRTDVLKTTNLPVLFVLGEFDNAIPLQDGLQQAPIPEISYIHILHLSGHMGMLEESGKSNEILKKFISET